jgi:hypothetical protein
MGPAGRRHPRLAHVAPLLGKVSTGPERGLEERGRLGKRRAALGPLDADRPRLSLLAFLPARQRLLLEPFQVCREKPGKQDKPAAGVLARFSYTMIR